MYTSQVNSHSVASQYENKCAFHKINNWNFHKNQGQWNGIKKKEMGSVFANRCKVAWPLFYWEGKLWHKEIEFWMPHTSKAWILKTPLQSGLLLNVSQGSENPPSRSSCRQSAWPPSPPKRRHIRKHCIQNQLTSLLTRLFFLKNCSILLTLCSSVPTMSWLSLPAMNMDASCSLDLFGPLADMGSPDGAVKGIVR